MNDYPDVDWDRVWRDHGSAVRAFAASLLRGRVPDGKTSDDIVGAVVQELMVKDALRGVTDERAFMITAVKRRCLDALARGQRQIVTEPSDVERDLPAFQVDHDAYEDQAAIAGFLDQIPERQRIALVEVVMKQRPVKDVATDLAVKPQRVSQLVREACASLCAIPGFVEQFSFDKQDVMTAKDRAT